jgi:heat shock protein HslJ
MRVSVLILAAAVMAAACSGGPAAKEAAFDDIRGRDWKLTALRTAAGESAFSREALEAAGFGNAYLLRFDEERVSGVAAPNRYTAPYALGEGQALDIQFIASTLMAGSEPPGLKEAEYFAYLDKVRRWDLADGRLELHTETPGGQGAVMVFAR